MNFKFVLFCPVTDSENLKTAERIMHRGNWAEVDVCLIVLEFVVLLLDIEIFLSCAALYTGRPCIYGGYIFDKL